MQFRLETSPCASAAYQSFWTRKFPVRRSIKGACQPGCTHSPLKRSPACPTLPCREFPMGVGPQTPLGCFRDRSPAGTRRNIHADHRARLRQTVLSPLHPLRSTRRSQGRGGSRPIVRHACQLLGPTGPYPDNSAIRSRRPAASAFASESHLRSPGGMSGPAGQPARPTRDSSRESPVSMHRLARGQPSPSICSRIRERPVAARRESPF
jgi:hypothetical protein